MDAKDAVTAAFPAPTGWSSVVQALLLGGSILRTLALALPVIFWSLGKHLWIWHPYLGNAPGLLHVVLPVN